MQRNTGAVRPSPVRMMRAARLVGLLLILLATARPAVTCAAPGDLLWWFQGIENINSIVQTADVDGDQTPDVAVETYDAGAGSTNHNLYLLSGADGTTIWSKRTFGGVSNGGGYGDDCLNLAGDMTDDGIRDLVLGTAWGGRSAHGIDTINGDQLWIFDTYNMSPPYPPASGWVYSAHGTGDLNGDEVPDAIFCAGSNNDGAYAVDGLDGSVIFRLDALDAVVSSAALGDVNGDGLDDVAFGGGDNEERVFCVSGASQTSATILWTYDLGDGTQHMTDFADVDGDGKRELLVGTWSYQVFCLSGATGTPLWVYPMGSGNVVMRVAELDDVDGDGVRDVAVASWANSVYVISGADGTFLWAGGTGGDVWAAERVDDVTGDGISEVVAGSFDGRAYLFDGTTGDQIWNYSTGSKVMSVRGFGDLSGNGVPDVVVGTQMLGGAGGKVYALEGNDSTPVEAPAVAGRPLRGGIEITWSADRTAPGTRFNIYRRAVGDVERLGGAALAASRAVERHAIATADLPARDKLALALALASPTLFERLNDEPILPDGALGRYLDTTAKPGSSYEYQVSYLEPGGDEQFLPAIALRAPLASGQSLLAIRPLGAAGQPHGFRISLPADVTGAYRVVLYGIDGRLAGELASGQLTPADLTLEIAWDGRGARGTTIPTGVYIAEVRVGQARATTKLLWLQ